MEGFCMRFSSKTLVIATFATISLFATSSHAEMFRSSDFLEWKSKTREMYIDASIGMASLIASQNNKEQSNCIDGWYFEDRENATSFILDAMSKNASYHPRGVILASVEKHCGQLSY